MAFLAQKTEILPKKWFFWSKFSKSLFWWFLKNTIFSQKSDYLNRFLVKFPFLEMYMYTFIYLTLLVLKLWQKTIFTKSYNFGRMAPSLIPQPKYIPSYQSSHNSEFELAQFPKTPSLRSGRYKILTRFKTPEPRLLWVYTLINTKRLASFTSWIDINKECA